MSPIRFVRDITVPMLIIHSEDDFRCPISQAEELFVAMRLLGKDVTFYRFPGEGHELSRSGSPVHRRQRAEIILDFFAAPPQRLTSAVVGEPGVDQLAGDRDRRRDRRQLVAAEPLGVDDLRRVDLDLAATASRP